MKQINFWSRKLYRRAIQQIGSLLYLNPEKDTHRSILVAGTARSGTTWLGDLIASHIPCRILFEPFNPDLVPEYRDFNYFQYMRPDRRHEELQAFASRVFTGEIRNRWIDRQNENIFSKYRLIKEIRANLLLKWLHVQFPQVRSVFLMRHPCAVVLSRMQLGWDTDRDIQPFLSQSDLVADHIRDHVDLIRSLKTDEEKHAVIWSVSNFVPLQQFKPGELNIVYYENLCIRTDTELQKIFQSLGLEYDRPAAGNADHPSQTSRAQSAVVTGSDKVSHWKNILSPAQIDRILNVVKAFGLDHLYDDSPLPLNSESKSDFAAKAGL